MKKIIFFINIVFLLIVCGCQSSRFAQVDIRPEFHKIIGQTIYQELGKHSISYLDDIERRNLLNEFKNSYSIDSNFILLCKQNEIDYIFYPSFKLFSNNIDGGIISFNKYHVAGKIKIFSIDSNSFIGEINIGASRQIPRGIITTFGSIVSVGEIFLKGQTNYGPYIIGLGLLLDLINLTQSSEKIWQGLLKDAIVSGFNKFFDNNKIDISKKDLLKKGMTINEIESIIGTGKLVSKKYNNEIYEWEDEGNRVIIIFNDGIVVKISYR